MKKVIRSCLEEHSRLTFVGIVRRHTPTVEVLKIRHGIEGMSLFAVYVTCHAQPGDNTSCILFGLCLLCELKNSSSDMSVEIMRTTFIGAHLVM